MCTRKLATARRFSPGLSVVYKDGITLAEGQVPRRIQGKLARFDQSSVPVFSNQGFSPGGASHQIGYEDGLHPLNYGDLMRPVLSV